MIERARIVPVVRSEIALRTSWNTASCNDNTENNESNDLPKDQ